jgi:hypothetical protein
VADLGQQLAVAVRQVMAEAAAYLALVIRSSPGGSADVLLARPDTNAVLREALDESRAAAEDLVRQAWDETGAVTGDDAVLKHLLDDIGRIFGNLAHLHGLIRHAHASVLRTGTGEHPDQQAAEERAVAVREALLGWGRQAALRARMAVHTAEGAGRTAAVLDGALVREAAGERLAKRWRAHADSPTCCLWCRRLNGVTIGLRESFAAYLGGPAAMPQSRTRRVATRAGERRYGMQAGERIIWTQPPRPYRGRLQGPLLHPFCRCRLEIVRAGDTASEGAPESPPAPVRFLSAADIRDMPEDEYEADRAFLRAAAYELDQVLKRLAGGGG